jgi:hypothetical protein
MYNQLLNNPVVSQSSLIPSFALSKLASIPLSALKEDANSVRKACNAIAKEVPPMNPIRLLSDTPIS